MEELVAGSNKRSRDDSAESPEPKRFKEADLVFDTYLEDDRAHTDSGYDDLADIIKSLEREISSPPTSDAANGRPQPDLGYLLEASDDELGLPPPAVGSTSSSSPGAGEDIVEIADEEPGFGNMWVFEDGIGPHEGLAFGILTEFDDAVIFNDGDGLFDFS